MQQEIWFQKYRIIKLLGRGGTAEVYLAEHIKLNSFRAIKCISNTHPSYEHQLREAQILKNLKHSCIPIIYDIEEDEDGSYIVEQYLEGETLKSYVEAAGTLGSDIVIRFALQLCDLIRYLHQIERPILYLDLKPENIIVTGETLKLIDFGSAMYLDEAEAGQDIFGTKGYAAPELYRSGEIDERSDVYGIGVLLHYMVTGKPLTDGRKSTENIDRNTDCSKKLKKIIDRCLKYNPSQRFATVTGLRKQLSAGRKLPSLCEAGPSVRFAVAGAQPRIGVTHLSFRLCSYFIHQKIGCIYREKNQSRCIRAIRNRYEELPVRDGVTLIGGIPMLDCQEPTSEETSGFHVIVEDYGCLTKENLSSFLMAEIPILVLGAKDWELESAEQVLNLVTEYKEIVYLFNFLDGRTFQQAMKNMDVRSCYRIPYEPDPFAGISDGAERELFAELIRLGIERITSVNEKKTDALYQD